MLSPSLQTTTTRLDFYSLSGEVQVGMTDISAAQTHAAQAITI